MEIIRKELRSVADSERARNLRRYFKTGVGDYGEGDVFLGLTSKQIKDIAKNYYDISFEEIESLLRSDIHEERVCALRILVRKFEMGDEEHKRKIFDFYLANTGGVNNWDLVDLSAPNIVGKFLVDKDREILYELARSENLWERRIGVVSTFAFIRENEFEDSLRIAKMLLGDEHDLIHKSVGWMLREVGKRDEEILKRFLKENYSGIPRTTLRYAIERFSDEERLGWLRRD